jgi:hypothetical protein
LCQRNLAGVRLVSVRSAESFGGPVASGARRVWIAAFHPSSVGGLFALLHCRSLVRSCQTRQQRVIRSPCHLGVEMGFNAAAIPQRSPPQRALLVSPKALSSRGFGPRCVAQYLESPAKLRSRGAGHLAFKSMLRRNGSASVFCSNNGKKRCKRDG